LLEVFGHLLLLAVFFSLVMKLDYFWPSVISYVVLQLVVMCIDRFRSWHPWPWIVRDWREKNINGSHA
jgi:hypothetical protein